jgi:transcriptional regulator with XRE-family HTH domain
VHKELGVAGKCGNGEGSICQRKSGLWEARIMFDLTQVDVANGADVSINTVRNAESGQRISPINLAKIAQFLKVTPEELISGGPYDKPEG